MNLDKEGMVSYRRTDRSYKRSDQHREAFPLIVIGESTDRKIVDSWVDFLNGKGIATDVLVDVVPCVTDGERVDVPYYTLFRELTEREKIEVAMKDYFIENDFLFRNPRFEHRRDKADTNGIFDGYNNYAR